MSSDMLPSRCPNPNCNELLAMFTDHCDKIPGKVPCNWIICPNLKCRCTVDIKLRRFYYMEANRTISDKL